MEVQKSSEKTVDVTDFNTLHNTLTSNTYDNITMNIKSDINLNRSIVLNELIKTLTINGNGKTINGVNKYSFLEIHNTNLVIENLTIKNCYDDEGGAIKNYDGSVIIIDSTLTENNAEWWSYMQ